MSEEDSHKQLFYISGYPSPVTKGNSHCLLYIFQQPSLLKKDIRAKKYCNLRRKLKPSNGKNTMNSSGKCHSVYCKSGSSQTKSDEKEY